MTSPFDHDRCSELLAAYARGELDAPLRAALEEHLAGCAGCRAEAAAVRALLAPAGRPLSELERARLHAAIAAGLAAAEPAPRSLWARLYPALGAAAALLVLFSAGYLTLRGDGGEDAATGAPAGIEQTTKGPGAGAPAPFADTPEEAGRAGDAGAGPEVLMAVGPLYDGDLGAISRRDLARLAARAPFPAFASTFDAGDAAAQRDAFADQLARAWGDGAARACIAALLSDEPGALPAYGADARLDGAAVLVVGAALAPSGSGPLSDYVVVAYDPSGCARVAGAAGPIPR